MNFSELLAQFVIYIKARYYSKATIASYASDLNDFNTFVQAQQKDYTHPDALNQYMVYLHKQGMSERTILRRQSALKQFFQYLCDIGTIDKLPTKNLISPKIPHTLPKVPSSAKILSFIEQLQKDTTYEGTLIYTLVYFLYGAGLRISEAVNLKKNALNLHEKTVSVIGKGKKERIVPLSDLFINHIMHYMKTCLHAEQVYLFPSKKHPNAPISRQYAARLLSTKTMEAGLPHVSPHKFRHAFATHMLENGSDIRTIQHLLGHKSISTTEIYTHLNQETLHETLKKHPLKDSHYYG